MFGSLSPVLITIPILLSVILPLLAYVLYILFRMFGVNSEAGVSGDDSDSLQDVSEVLFTTYEFY